MCKITKFPLSAQRGSARKLCRPTSGAYAISAPYNNNYSPKATMSMYSSESRACTRGFTMQSYDRIKANYPKFLPMGKNRPQKAVFNTIEPNI